MEKKYIIAEYYNPIRNEWIPLATEPAEIKKKRKFNYENIKIDTDTKFPSTYHIFLCEFGEL